MRRASAVSKRGGMGPYSNVLCCLHLIGPPPIMMKGRFEFCRDLSRHRLIEARRSS
jgi:hypothetical protein